MANKVTPKISAPGSIKMPQGGRNTNVGEHSRGGVLGKPGRSVPNGQALGRLPIQRPTANLANQTIGQREAMPPGPGSSVRAVNSGPVTGNPVATKKPNRKGGAAFYGET